MRYYAEYDGAGKLIAVGTGYGGTEITEAEYNALLSAILEKNRYAEQLVNEEISIEDVPEEIRAEVFEIYLRMKEEKERDEKADSGISAEDAESAYREGVNQA